MEERRTFRYRSPPHNRTSVTEGAIPDHLVSLHQGRPGHLAVTSVVRSSSLFSSLSVTSLSFFLSLTFCLSLSLDFLSQVNRLRVIIAGSRISTVCISTWYVRKRQRERERERKRENYILDQIFHIPEMHPGPTNLLCRILSFRTNSTSVYGLRYVWHFNRQSFKVNLDSIGHSSCWNFVGQVRRNLNYRTREHFTFMYRSFNENSFWLPVISVSLNCLCRWRVPLTVYLIPNRFRVDAVLNMWNVKETPISYLICYTFKIFLKKEICIYLKKWNSENFFLSDSRVKKSLSLSLNAFFKAIQMTISLGNRCRRTRNRSYCFRRVVECGATPPRLPLYPHVTALLVTFVWLPGQARVAEDPEVRPTRRINRPLAPFFFPFLHDERRCYSAF